jgi:hypothetical protein
MFLNSKNILNTNKINKRKSVLEERRNLSNWSSIIALVGIFLMITEAELSIARIIDKVNQ